MGALKDVIIERVKAGHFDDSLQSTLKAVLDLERGVLAATDRLVGLYGFAEEASLVAKSANPQATAPAQQPIRAGEVEVTKSVSVRTKGVNVRAHMDDLGVG